MKSFWKSRNLFSKRFLAAGGKSGGGFWPKYTVKKKRESVTGYGFRVSGVEP
jgi:hypothetical protein